MAIDFGEKLLWTVRQKNKLEKHNPRRQYEEGLQAVRIRLVGVRWEQQRVRETCAVEEEWHSDPEVDGELFEALDARQRQRPQRRDQCEKSSSTRRGLHRESFTSRRETSKRTRAVHDAEPCSKAAPGRRIRRNAE